MYNLVNLEGRSILIAGASSGIGKATALLVSKLGAKAILVARREEKLKEVVSLMNGDRHSYYVADLSEIEQIERLVVKIIDEQGPLDGMVFSAGIGRSQPIKFFSPEKVSSYFHINYFAFYETVRQIIKKRRYNEGMRIVGISSVAAYMGDKGQTVYAATKGAMNSSIRCMAHELAEKGICVNAVAPGMVATEMYEGFLNKYGGEESESNKRLLASQYLGIIQPDDIAKAIAFLLSDASKYITGITLPVSAGIYV